MKTAPAYSETAVRRVALGAEHVDRADVLAVEEPLEIRLGFSKDGKIEHRAISITMRTPGDDFDLAAGFLFTEGILKDRDQIVRIRHCGIGRNPTGRAGVSQNKSTVTNTVVVELIDGVDVDLKRLERNFYTTSSCGVCGKSSIEALRTGVTRLADGDLTVSPDIIHRLPAALLSVQTTFEKTGGLHASILFDINGNVDTICEDVGRHNALEGYWAKI